MVGKRQILWACDQVKLHWLPYFSNYTYIYPHIFTHGHEITADPTYREAGEALIECHGSLHWGACVLEIELVWYTDTEQAQLEDRPTGNRIGECKQGTGGGWMGKRKWVRKWKMGEMGVAVVHAGISYSQSFTVVCISSSSPSVIFSHTCSSKKTHSWINYDLSYILKCCAPAAAAALNMRVLQL